MRQILQHGHTLQLLFMCQVSEIFQLAATLVRSSKLPARESAGNLNVFVLGAIFVVNLSDLCLASFLQRLEHELLLPVGDLALVRLRLLLLFNDILNLFQ